MPRISDCPPAHIADIHYYYGMYRGSARAARIAYLAAFPNRRPEPSARNFQEVHRRLANTGLGLSRDRREPGVLLMLLLNKPF